MRGTSLPDTSTPRSAVPESSGYLACLGRSSGQQMHLDPPLQRLQREPTTILIAATQVIWLSPVLRLCTLIEISPVTLRSLHRRPGCSSNLHFDKKGRESGVRHRHCRPPARRPCQCVNSRGTGSCKGVQQGFCEVISSYGPGAISRRAGFWRVRFP